MKMVLDDGGSKTIVEPSKVICLLRNYSEHAKELNNPLPGRPRFFLKPPSSLLPEGGSIIIPEGVNEVHHEVELGVVISKRARSITAEEAPGHILGYLLMLDITARDLQDEAKAKGLPWAEAKGFDTFAPFGGNLSRFGPRGWMDRRIYLDVNGTRRQDGNTTQMIYGVEEIISALSEVMTLEKDDLILTGTPAGVGRLSPGDVVVAGIEGIGESRFHVRSQM